MQDMHITARGRADLDRSGPRQAFRRVFRHYSCPMRAWDDLHRTGRGIARIEMKPHKEHLIKHPR